MKSFLKCLKILIMPQEKEKKNGKIEIAKKLLEIGMTIEQIIDVTQLSKEEIEKIVKEK